MNCPSKVRLEKSILWGQLGLSGKEGIYHSETFLRKKAGFAIKNGRRMLTLNSSGAVSAGKLKNFVGTYHVEVAFDAVL